ncbi:hypothetical protein SAMD00019534_096550 [Acytostelium subglobosum LB1]|uniref:hypothetical protein n=1 Tax=Acytostelium subglobosum LB1 TaxID=1410327 RepID=UPI000644A1F7|nr:hypothetical protein SAMD00019534_096550 [Acytostelium subglobosum LB1]GAM26480.1 hypothetical protein SAMD00019534_096550 [Acytostelium subglobosum LB1]|eukprot:XP_012750576.1 hypothetical protein SAMD00019534_096550 [Acytostelium subglobosum LB1]
MSRVNMSIRAIDPAPGQTTITTSSRFIDLAKSSLIIDGITFKDSRGPTDDPYIRHQLFTGVVPRAIGFIRITDQSTFNGSRLYFRNITNYILMHISTSRVSLFKMSVQACAGINLIGVFRSNVTMDKCNINTNNMEGYIAYNFISSLTMSRVSINSNIVLCGFFMKRGRITTSMSRFDNNYSNIGLFTGDNVYFWFANCIFYDNFATDTPGVIYGSLISKIRFYVCIFKDNASKGTAVLASASRSGSMWYCVFNDTKNNPTTLSISLFGRSRFEFIEVYFKNQYGTLLSTDSNSIIVMAKCVFDSTHGEIIKSFGNSFIFFINNEVVSAQSPSALISLSHRSHAIMTYNLFHQCFGSTIISTSFSSNISITLGYFKTNLMTTSVLEGNNYYNYYIHKSIFYNNTGIYQGAVFSQDSTGRLILDNSRILNNTGPTGPFVYTSRTVNRKYCNTFLGDLTIANNVALQSGAVNYHATNDICPFRCDFCAIIGNQSPYAKDFSSEYHNFSVDMPNVIDTPGFIKATIFAYDRYNNLYKGTNDVIFSLTSDCPNLNITSGVTSVGLTPSGRADMYNIELSGIPNTTCHLKFWSDPNGTGGYVYKAIWFRNCAVGKTPFYAEGRMYCVTREKVAKVAIIIVAVISGVLLLLLLASLVLTILYRKNALIVNSNPVFLLVVLFGCFVLVVACPLAYMEANVGCAITREVLIPLGNFFIIIPIVIKQYRIWRIRKQLNFQKKSLISTKYLLIRLGILMIVPVAIIVAELAVQKARVHEHIDLDNFKVFKSCNNTDIYFYIGFHIGYLAVLYIVSSLIIFLNRDFLSTPGTFNEPKFLGILIYNNFLVLVVFTSLRFSFLYAPTSTFLVITITTQIIVLSTIFLLYFPKFYFIFRKDRVVLSMIKFIEEQETILQRNREILKFYEMYCNQEGDINFGPSHHIFTPDTPSPILANNDNHAAVQDSDDDVHYGITNQGDDQGESSGSGSGSGSGNGHGDDVTGSSKLPPITLYNENIQYGLPMVKMTPDTETTRLNTPLDNAIAANTSSLQQQQPTSPNVRRSGSRRRHGLTPLSSSQESTAPGHSTSQIRSRSAPTSPIGRTSSQQQLQNPIQASALAPTTTASATNIVVQQQQEEDDEDEDDQEKDIFESFNQQTFFHSLVEKRKKK